MIEHDMEFISRLCNPVIVMAEGSVLFEGTLMRLKKMKKLLKVIWVEDQNQRMKANGFF